MKYNEPYIKGVGGGGGALPYKLFHNFINYYICVDLEKSLVLLFEVQAKDLHNFTFSLATRGLITITGEMSYQDVRYDTQEFVV